MVASEPAGARAAEDAEQAKPAAAATEDNAPGGVAPEDIAAGITTHANRCDVVGVDSHGDDAKQERRISRTATPESNHPVTPRVTLSRRQRTRSKQSSRRWMWRCGLRSKLMLTQKPRTQMLLQAHRRQQSHRGMMGTQRDKRMACT